MMTVITDRKYFLTKNESPKASVHCPLQAARPPEYSIRLKAKRYGEWKYSFTRKTKVSAFYQNFDGKGFLRPLFSYRTLTGA